MSAITFGGLAKAKDGIILPLKGSFPYDYNRTLPFILTYTFQALSIYVGSFVTIGSETFVMTMMMQICTQLDIIFHRLQNLPFLYRNNNQFVIFSKKEARVIRNCVIHHNYVYRYNENGVF